MSSNMVTMLALVKRVGTLEEVFGFLEPNGTGKSTTIRILRGLLKPGASAADIWPVGSAKVGRIRPSLEDVFVATVEAR